MENLTFIDRYTRYFSNMLLNSLLIQKWRQYRACRCVRCLVDPWEGRREKQRSGRRVRPTEGLARELVDSRLVVGAAGGARAGESCHAAAASR